MWLTCCESLIKNFLILRKVCLVKQEKTWKKTNSRVISCVAMDKQQPTNIERVLYCVWNFLWCDSILFTLIFMIHFDWLIFQREK